MNKTTILFLPIVGLLITAACGCTPATRATHFSNYPPRPPGHEIKLYSTKLPDQPYEEIGLVRSRQRNQFSSIEMVLESLKDEARKMGGDAIIGLTEVNEAQGIDGFGILDLDPVLSGTVIRFQGDEK